MKSNYRWAEALYKRSDGDPDVMGKEEVKMVLKLVRKAD